MPIQIQEISNENEGMECPLCMEPLEVDDINFFPCTCGYQICRFCWHRIRTDENGLCPACRTSYPENPAEFRPLTGSDLQKIRLEKKQKEVQRRQKLSDGRRHLAAMRVLQKNLVFVIGLSQRLSDAEILKRQDYFGKYGKILKVVINSNTAYAGSQGPSCSAYVTYSKMEEALRAIQAVNNVHIDGRTLKASLGTTKYCSTYLKNQQCQKIDCMYLHEMAEEESSFTKEDMQAGKHQELEQRLITQMIQKEEASPQMVSSSSNFSHEVSYDGDRTPIQSSKNSGLSSFLQPVHKVENNWSSGMPETFEPMLPTGVQSSLEDNKPISKNSPEKSNKKTSLWRASKQHKNGYQTNSDFSNASSESSSAATTPPPANVGWETDTSIRNTKLESNVKQEDESAVVSLHKPDDVTDPRKEYTDVEKQDDSLAKVTEDLFISQILTTAKQQCVPSERYGHGTEDVSEVGRISKQAKTYIPNLNPSLWDPQPRNTIPELPDAIPIQSSNDWEAAFGFPKSNTADDDDDIDVDGEDDDLGFDPWLECSKGLAVLLEKETADNKMQHMNPPQPPIGGNHVRNNFLRMDRSHSLLYDQVESKTTNYANGFTPFHNMRYSHNETVPHNTLQQLSPFDTSGSQSSSCKGLSDWKNGLRALLPSVNINFAMDGNQIGKSINPTNPNPNMHCNVTGAQFTSASAGNKMPIFPTGSDDWNAGCSTSQSFFPSTNVRNPSNFNNSFALHHTNNHRYTHALPPPPGLRTTPSFHSDPAIISSKSKARMPAHFQNQPINDETPHWMKSIQTLTDTDSSINPSPSSRYLVNTEQTPSPSQFFPWRNFSDSSASNIPSQPPPGFQTRLPFAQTKSDFRMRNGMLGNQS